MPRASEVFDIIGAIGIVAMVMMFVRPNSRGPELVRSVAQRWSEITASAVLGGEQ